MDEFILAGIFLAVLYDLYLTSKLQHDVELRDRVTERRLSATEAQVKKLQAKESK